MKIAWSNSFGSGLCTTITCLEMEVVGSRCTALGTIVEDCPIRQIVSQIQHLAHTHGVHHLVGMAAIGNSQMVLENGVHNTEFSLPLFLKTTLILPHSCFHFCFSSRMIEHPFQGVFWCHYCWIFLLRKTLEVCRKGDWHRIRGLGIVAVSL